MQTILCSGSEQSVIVWDLETIPDLAAAARMFDMETAAEADVRQAGSSAPQQARLQITESVTSREVT
jgi:hypothetical protein